MAKAVILALNQSASANPQPQIGDSLRLSGVTLIVRDLDEDRVHRVGLKFGAGTTARGGKAKHLARVRALVKRFVRQK